MRDITTFINRSKETIQRLKKSDMDETYVNVQIAKLKDAIEEKQKLLDQLNIDMHAISRGKLDDEINEERKYNQKIAQNIRKDKIKSSAMKKEENDEKKEVSKNYWEKISKTSRNNRQIERDVKYTYKYSNKVIDTLPDYIKKNLLEMPNNKGYIWRGVHFYGNLPEKPGPRIMFEKKRGGVLIIHEYTDYEYRKYEKEGKNRKKLVHQSPKRVIKYQSSIMDYLKQ